jgi:hypothetical protein
MTNSKSEDYKYCSNCDCAYKIRCKCNHIPDAAEEVELKPCPFCGDVEKLNSRGRVDHYCLVLDYHLDIDGVPEDAIKKWNTRHDSRASVLDQVLEEAITKSKESPCSMHDTFGDVALVISIDKLKQIIQKAKEQKR